MPGSIRSMHVEHILRDVQTDRGSLLHGRLLRWQFDTATLAHRCRRGASTLVPSAASGKQKSYASQAGPPVGSDQASTSCLEHHDGTCAPTGGHDGCPVGS